jgi:hypothetical protein
MRGSMPDSRARPIKGHQVCRVAILLAAASCAALGLCPGGASAKQFVTPGAYAGVTSQRCPVYAAEVGECESGAPLPVSFVATRKAILSFRAVVIESCEDSLRPRLATMEIPGPLHLKREKNRMSFSTSRNWNTALRRTGAIGFVKRKIANGYLSALSKVASDTYCFVRGIEWRASSR